MFFKRTAGKKKSASNHHFFRKKEKVILDTCVISASMKDEKGSNRAKWAVKTAESKERYIYTDVVDSELKNTTDRDSEFKRRVEKYRKEHRAMMRKVSSLTEAELKSYPARREDKKILHAAVKTGTNVIVTQDKTFARKSDNYRGIRVLMPRAYKSYFWRKNMIKYWK